MMLRHLPIYGVFSGSFALLAATFVACGGDPGVSIPDPSPTSGPGAATEPAPGGPGGGGAEEPSATLAVAIEGTGRVVSLPAGIDCPGSCSARFPLSTRVTLLSSPAEGWRFGNWTGACSGAGDCSFVLAADTTVTSALALIDMRWDPSVGGRDCDAAWGAGGERLSPCDKTKDNYVVVRKSARNLALCKAGRVIKNFRSGLGFKPVGDKEREGDGKTPEGVFYVPRRLPDSSAYKALLLSYPTNEDAARGVASGLISSTKGALIEAAHAACEEPPQTTALGGNIEVAGGGSVSDWTSGNVAIENAGMDELWGVIDVNDTIVVLP